MQDIHIDRGDGNRQRQMNYDYAQSKLCQPSAMPGFLHHNTDRFDGRRVDWTIRDYDFYGASYTILSAIATGGVNMVVCDVPARDLGEFAAFPQTAADNRTVSVDFYRSWFAFAEEHKQHLLRTKFLPQPPAPGAIDGTYAMLNGSGFLFLFNPNAEAAATPDGLLTASAASLDTTCAPGDSLAVGELWPSPSDGALFTVACGANFSVACESRRATRQSSATSRTEKSLQRDLSSPRKPAPPPAPPPRMSGGPRPKDESGDGVDGTLEE